MDRTHDREELHDLLEVVHAAGEPTIDLGLLIGGGTGPCVSVRNLLGVVASHEDPEVTLSWSDGDASLTVQKTDGGVLATLEVKF